MKDSCCVRGRQGAIHSPGHWTRDLLRLPPIAAELPEEFEQSFLIGKPWFFGEHEFLTEQCILSQFRLRCFRGSRLVALVFFLSYCDFIFMLSFSLTSLEVCFRALLVQCFQSFLPDIRLPPRVVAFCICPNPLSQTPQRRGAYFLFSFHIFKPIADVCIYSPTIFFKINHSNYFDENPQFIF